MQCGYQDKTIQLLPTRTELLTQIGYETVIHMYTEYFTVTLHGGHRQIPEPIVVFTFCIRGFEPNSHELCMSSLKAAITFASYTPYMQFLQKIALFIGFSLVC